MYHGNWWVMTSCNFSVNSICSHSGEHHLLLWLVATVIWPDFFSDRLLWLPAITSVLTVFAHIVENTAFFGDLLLWLPAITSVLTVFAHIVENTAFFGDLLLWLPAITSVLTVFAHIVENTAFFGDLLLRIPDMTHDLLRRNHEWHVLIHWSIGFANETGIYEKADAKLLHLASRLIMKWNWCSCNS